MMVLLALLLLAAGWAYLLQRPDLAGRFIQASVWAFVLYLASPLALCLLAGSLGDVAFPDLPWGVLVLGWSSLAAWLVQRTLRPRLKPSQARLERERIRGVERKRIAPREGA